MKVNERSLVIILAGILLGILVFCFCSINASADEKGFAKNSKALEAEYKTQIKDVLGKFHIGTAGITMNKELHNGEDVVYSVTIHISAFKNLNKLEKEQLLDDLTELEMGIENAEVNFSFS